MQYLSCFDAKFVPHPVGNRLACSVCDGIFRTEIGAPCLPLAELEGKVSAARLTDEVSINRGDSRNIVIRREQACPLAVAGNSH